MMTYLLIGSLYTLASSYCFTQIRKIPLSWGDRLGAPLKCESIDLIVIYLVSVALWPIDLIGTLVLAINKRI